MARGRKTALAVELSEDERKELESWQRSTTIASGLARRWRIVLLRAEGVSISDISRRVGMRRWHVEKWIRRFVEEKIDGLADKQGRGRKPAFPPGGGRACGQAGVRAA